MSKILFCPADKGGSAYYRMFLPYQSIKLKSELCVYKLNEELSSFSNYDLVIIQRQFSPALLEIVRELKGTKTKIVYELDDNILNLPESNPSYSYWKTKLTYVKRLLMECNAIITSTLPLARELQRYNKVHIIPNFILEPYTEFDMTPKDKISIGYGGSTSHRDDFQPFIINALLQIKEEFKDKVSITFVGWMPDELKGLVSFYPFVDPINYLDFMRSCRFDIGIIPCVQSLFNNNKSNLKYLENSINKTVSIASPTYPYVNTIEHLADGFLVKKNKTSNWYKAIKLFIEDRQLLKRVSNKAYLKVKNDYMIMDNSDYILRKYKLLQEMK